MDNKRRVALVACSNPLAQKDAFRVEEIEELLVSLGMTVLPQKYLFAGNDGVRGAAAKERAACVNAAFADETVTDIFDISGGDIANEVLPFLDYGVIARSKAVFWGYSDLTVVLNAIYHKTGKKGMLYQLRLAFQEITGERCREFSSYLTKQKPNLLTFPYEMVQGDTMEGVVVGGNIRCFLKLAGTEYFPELKDKILLLEANSGRAEQMITYLSQLKQLGAFEKVNGILLGTYTQMEREGYEPDIVTLVKEIAGEGIAIAKTNYIGHGVDSKGILIGQNIVLSHEGR